MNSPIARRIAGTATLVAVIALAALGFEYRFARTPKSTDIILEVAETGVGMAPGTDVKIRGVPVGQVVDVKLRPDGTPVITARLDPGVKVPKGDVTVSITPKTFFGEKQIEIHYPLETFGQPPFLQENDVLVVTEGVTSVEKVLNVLQPLLDRIDPNDLATLFDATAALEGEGEQIARNLDVSAQLAEFGTSISDDALRNARLLTSLANQLEDGADAFDRLNRALPPAVAVLSERREEIDTNLEALSSLALTTAEWIDVEEDLFDRLLDQNDIVGAFLERNVESIPSIIEGIRIFAEVQSRPSPYLDDNTIYVPFKIFLDVQGALEGLLGEQLLGALSAAGDA